MAILAPGIFSHWSEVTGGCMAVSAVLGARLWVCAPVGFQLAPAKARRVRGAARRRRSMMGELFALETDLKVAPFLALPLGLLYPLIGRRPLAESFLRTFAMSCVMLAAGASVQRASLLEAALPIPARKLLAVRLASTFAFAWLLALVVIGETVVLRGWGDALPLLELAAASTTLWLTAQSARIRETAPRRRAAIWIYCVGFGPLVFFPRIVDVLHVLHAPMLLGACVIVSASLAVRLYIITPEGFQIAPMRAARPPRFTLRWPGWRHVWSPPWLPAWRSFPIRHVLWMGVFFAWVPALIGMSLVFGSAVAITALTGLQRLAWLLVMPISRRRLLPMMLLPGLCVVIATVLGIGYLRADRKGAAVSTGPGTSNVQVPSTFWNWTWGSEAPVIQSPWGETTRPKTFIRLGFPFCNPYSVAPHNSPRFLEWQFARATEAVYGRAVPLSQAAELAKPGLVPVTRQLRTRAIEALAAALGYLGFFYLALWRKTSGGRVWAVLLWIAVIVPFFADFFTPGPVLGSGMLSDIVTVRLAAILPQNPAALAAVAALLLAGAYLAVERRFEEVDLVPGTAPRARRKKEDR